MADFHRIVSQRPSLCHNASAAISHHHPTTNVDFFGCEFRVDFTSAISRDCDLHHLKDIYADSIELRTIDEVAQGVALLCWFFNSFNHNRTTRHFSEIFFSFALIIGTLLSAAIVSRRHMCRSVYLCTKQCIHDTRAADKCVFRIFNFVSLLLESLRSNGNADDSPQ